MDQQERESESLRETASDWAALVRRAERAVEGARRARFARKAWTALKWGVGTWGALLAVRASVED